MAEYVIFIPWAAYIAESANRESLYGEKKKTGSITMEKDGARQGANS